MKAIADDFPSYLFILGRINHTAAGKKITHSARRLLKGVQRALLQQRLAIQERLALTGFCWLREKMNG